MRAADALFKALKAEGVEHVFGIPGGANLPTYDALYDADITHIQARHEQGAGHAAEGYAKASGRVGVALRHLGPGSDQPGDRDRRRDDGLGPDRVHHRPGAHGPDRHRRLPGGRRHRDHDAGRQALDAGHRPASRSPTTSTPPSTSPRPGAPGRCWSTSRRTSRGPTSTTRRPRGSPNLPGYKPPTEGNIKQIRIAAKALANARRPVIYGGGGIVNANASEEFREFCTSDKPPGHADRDGPGRLPGPARAVARDARHARHPDRQLRDGRRRPDRRASAPASTTGSPASSRSSRRGPSSSTSTSTRPRSRRTSRRTSRSSATPRTCSRS